MVKDQLKGVFGVDDHPRCDHCDKPMYVVRRIPEQNKTLELQILACLCGEVMERRVDEAGNIK